MIVPFDSRAEQVRLLSGHDGDGRAGDATAAGADLDWRPKLGLS
jgi:hypothetical protein